MDYNLEKFRAIIKINNDLTFFSLTFNSLSKKTSSGSDVHNVIKKCALTFTQFIHAMIEILDFHSFLLGFILAEYINMHSPFTQFTTTHKKLHDIITMINYKTIFICIYI